MDTPPKRIDYIGMFAVEQPVDIGWGVAVLHADRTVTRTCKSCGVSVRTAISPAGVVAEAAIAHRSTCAVVFGNNAVRS